MQDAGSANETSSASSIFFVNLVNVTLGFVSRTATNTASVITNATATVIAAGAHAWRSETASNVTDIAIAVASVTTDAASSAGEAVCTATNVILTTGAAATTVVVDGLQSIQVQVGEKLYGENTEDITESARALDAFKSFIRRLQTDATMTLRDKKSHFLSSAKTHIEKLTNDDIIALFADYQNDRQKSGSLYFFIYAEDVNKPIGWIKQSIFNQKNPTGNTDTHKEFLGLLKKRALVNIAALKKRTDEKVSALFSDSAYKHAIDKIQPLMITARGRVGNAFAWIGAGYEGDYKNREFKLN